MKTTQKNNKRTITKKPTYSSDHTSKDDDADKTGTDKDADKTKNDRSKKRNGLNNIEPKLEKNIKKFGIHVQSGKHFKTI